MIKHSDADMLTASGLLMSYLYSGSYTSFSYPWPYADTVPRPSYGWYSAEYYSGTQNILWDRSGQNNNAVTSGVTLGAGSGNGATSSSVTYLTGGTSSSILWPAQSIPSAFTMCGITRYLAGGTNQLILTSTNNNNNDRCGYCGCPNGGGGNHWMSLVYYCGHYNPTTNNANAQRGVVFQSDWVTSQTSVGTLTDWLVVCTSTNGINTMINGVSSGAVTGCVYNPIQTLSINKNSAGFQSSFGYSQLMIWNTILTTTQVQAASTMLMSYLSSGKYANFPSAEPSYAPTPATTIGMPFTAMPSSPTGQPSTTPTHSAYFAGNCPGGMYQSNNQCVMCPAGTFLSSGQHKCTACPAGTCKSSHYPILYRETSHYMDNNVIFILTIRSIFYECLLFVIGTYSVSAGVTTCTGTFCPAGTLSSVTIAFDQRVVAFIYAVMYIF